MGKINSGILGPISGRIGGVVGARWKSQPYLRSYVVPGASNTALQLAQRARFAYVVASAKYFVGRVFNPYYDKFLSKVSGFNRYCSNNIPKAPGFTPIDNYIVTDGPLYPGSAMTAVFDSVGHEVEISWNPALGVDGADDDVAIYWVRDRISNVVLFGADSTRVTALVQITSIPAGWVAANLDCGVFFAKMTGTLVSKISRNLAVTATAA